MERRNHLTDILFVLTLFSLFVVLALFVVVLGANVYKGISKNMDSNYSVRSSLTYLTEKIRQSDTTGGYALRTTEAGDALVLTTVEGNETYDTWIYLWDEELCELTVSGGELFALEDGQPIMPLKSLQMTHGGDGLIHINLTDHEGKNFESYVLMKSGKAG